MPKFKLSGDICHPGYVEVECSVAQLSKILDDEGAPLFGDPDLPELYILDEQTDPKLTFFVPDGSIFDENDRDFDISFEERKVEFLLAYEDRSWRTEVYDVPFDVPDQESELISWWNENRSHHEHGVVAVLVYNMQPEDQEG